MTNPTRMQYPRQLKGKKPPPLPPPQSSSSPQLEHLHQLKHSNLNVSAGGNIYERAKSRRERHRQALMSSNNTALDSAIPLGRSGKRGPGRTADLHSDRIRDKLGMQRDDEEK
eukprot:14607264-Ditylum_brightwellii.AAC.1